MAGLLKPYGLRLKRAQRSCPFAIYDLADAKASCRAVASLNMRVVEGCALVVEHWSEMPRLAEGGGVGERREEKGKDGRDAAPGSGKKSARASGVEGEWEERCEGVWLARMEVSGKAAFSGLGSGVQRGPHTLHKGVWEGVRWSRCVT